MGNKIVETCQLIRPRFGVVYPYEERFILYVRTVPARLNQLPQFHFSEASMHCLFLSFLPQVCCWRSFDAFYGLINCCFVTIPILGNKLFVDFYGSLLTRRLL